MPGRGVKRRKPASPSAARKRKQGSSTAASSAKSVQGPMDKMIKKISDRQNETGCLLMSYQHADAPNICGKSDLLSMTSLITEWIETEAELIDEDVAYIHKFAIDLIDENDVSKIKILLDTFYHAVKLHKAESDDWKNVYNEVAKMILNESIEVDVFMF